MRIMRPPQHGHGAGPCVGVSGSGAASGTGGGDGIRCEQLSGAGDHLAALRVGEEAHMADAVELVGQHMQQEPSGEHRGVQCHGPVTRRAVTAVVLDPDRDARSVIGGDAAVGDGDPVSVAGEITEHLLESGEGALGVDDPVAPSLAFEQRRERVGIRQMGEIAMEAELAGGVEPGEPLAHQPTEQTRHSTKIE